MIAKANLETKRKALTERASKLAFEKIACFERIDEIGRSLEQIDLLSKVMDVTLADIEADGKEVEETIGIIEDDLEEAREEIEVWKASKGNDEGEHVTHPG